jgi:hypothetical protein
MEKHSYCLPHLWEAPSAPETAQFFMLLYGNQHGWCRLFAHDGNPQDQTTQNREYWQYYDGSPDALLYEYTHLVKRYGNVYVATTLFTKKQGIETNALPLRVVLVEDYLGGADLPCSFLVQTSASSSHAYWKLPAPLPVDQYKPIARAMTHQLGGDPSGACVKLVRPPGSVNRKPNRNNYRAVLRINPDAPDCYSIDDLTAAFPPGQQPELVLVPELSLELQRQIDYWRDNIDELLNDEGVPRRIVPKPGKKETQTYRVLAGKDTSFHADSSLTRAVVMRGLLLYGYPQAEAIALCCELVPPARGQNDAWLLTDSLRLFEKERAKLGNKYSPSASRPKGKCSPVKNTTYDTPTKRRRGRPKTDVLTADGLYLYYQEQGAGSPCKILKTVQEVANDLHVPKSQVERAERELRNRGEMRREISSCRRYSWVELPNVRPCKNPAEPASDGFSAESPDIAETKLHDLEREYTGESAGAEDNGSPCKNHARPQGRYVPEKPAAAPESVNAESQCKEPAHTGETPHTASAVCSPPTPPPQTPDTAVTDRRTLAELVELLLTSDPYARFADVVAYCQKRGYDNEAAIRYWFDKAKEPARIAAMPDRDLKRQIAIAEFKIEILNNWHAVRETENALGQAPRWRKRGKPTEQELKQESYWRWRYAELKREQEQRTPCRSRPPEPAPDEPDRPASTIKLDYLKRLLARGDMEAAERHVTMCGAGRTLEDILHNLGLPVPEETVL